VGFELTTLVVIDTDCPDSCKSNYHTVMTMTAPENITHLRKFAEKLSKEKRGQGIGIEATTLVVMCTDCRDKFN
jgi:hypothetical protein